jgi:hypothetical protein
MKYCLILCSFFSFPVWSYGIQLWGCAKPFHTQIIQRLQSKLLRSMTGAPWNVSNLTLHTDLRIPFVTEEIQRLYRLYHHQLANHPNDLITDPAAPLLMAWRLKCWWPIDLLRKHINTFLYASKWFTKIFPHSFSHNWITKLKDANYHYWKLRCRFDITVYIMWFSTRLY